MNAWVTSTSIDWMREKAASDKPFFLSMGYFDPHHAWNPCEPYASRFAYSEVSPPKYDPDDIAKKPSLWEEWAPARDPFNISSIIRSYHAMIAHLDDCLGRLIEALDQAGQLENTVIVFTSDHGEFLGNHARLFKGPFLCDDLLRVPMAANRIISWQQMWDFRENMNTDPSEIFPKGFPHYNWGSAAYCFLSERQYRV